MSDFVSIFLILFLVYALQGIATAAPCSTVFILDSGEKGQLLRRYWRFSPSRRLFVLNPFYPLSRAVYVDRQPVSFPVEPSGEIRNVNFTNPASGSSDVVVTLDASHRFTSKSNQVQLDDKTVATLHSEYSASRIAALLNRLQSTPASKRSSLVKIEFRSTLRFDAIGKRLELFSQCTGLLNSLCLALFLLIFVAAPLNIYLFGLHRVWLTLVVMLIVFSIAVLWAFRKASRRLNPEAAGVDVKHLVTIALSPLAAIRAADPLASDLLADFHPIAVACALLPRENFVAFAARELRNVKFVLQDGSMEECFMDFLRSQKADPQSLLAPPEPFDASCRTYCPACLAQYMVEQGACRDCDGVSLRPLNTAPL
jgi:hypothetical protein